MEKTTPEADTTNDSEIDNSYLRLRQLLLGEDYSSAIKRYISREDDIDRVSHVLPEALKAIDQTELGDTMAPIVDEAISSSIEDNPKRITNILFPIMGPSIRKAVASALAEMVQSLNTLLEQSLTLGSLSWRFKAWRSGMPYAQYVLLETIQYRVEQVLLVHRETGLLLNSVTASNVETQDPELVSSMLTAISDFVSDSFSSSNETLERVRFGELELQIIAGPHAILAVAVRGTATDELGLTASETIEAIHSDYAHPLNHFDGDRSEFEETADLLSKCLLTKKIEQKEKGKPWLAMVILSGLFLYFVFQSYEDWRINQQMNEVEQGLRNEPQYIVVSTERSDTKFLATILRSNESRGTQSFIDTLSKDISIDIIIEDQLVHFGPIPAPIIQQVAPPPPIIEEQPDLKELLREQINRIQNTSLYFEPNESSLPQQELVKITRLVNSIKKAEQTAKELGLEKIQIMVMGFADRSGSASLNLEVSQKRADTVKNILEENLEGSELLVAWGLGNIDHQSVSEESKRRVRLMVSHEDIKVPKSPIETSSAGELSE